MTSGASEVPPVGGPPTWRRVVRGLVTVAVVVLVFGFVLPRLSDHRRVLDTMAGVPPGVWVAMTVLALTALIAYPLVLRSALATLRFREAFVAQTTAQAVNNALPAGGAVAVPIQYGMYLSWGFTPSSVTAMLLTAGVWDQFARLGLPVLALTIAAASGGASPWMWIATATGLSILVIAAIVLRAVLGAETAARRLGTLLERLVNAVRSFLDRRPLPVAATVLQLRSDLADVLAGRWRALTMATLVNHVAHAGLFLAAVRGAGIDDAEIPWPLVVAGFAFGRFLAAIPVAPGGLGVVDLGWVGLLATAWQGTGAADLTAITAGVLLYRALTYLPPIPVGVVTWVVYRLNRSWRRDWRLHRRGEWERVPRGGSADRGVAS